MTCGCPCHDDPHDPAVDECPDCTEPKLWYVRVETLSGPYFFTIGSPLASSAIEQAIARAEALGGEPPESITCKRTWRQVQ